MIDRLRLPSRAFSILCFLTALSAPVLMSGCAGSMLSKITGGEAALPKELSEKFEVKEAVAPSPQPSPSIAANAISQISHEQEAAASKTKSSAKSKTKEKKKPQVASDEVVSPTPAAFKYLSRRPTVEPIWVGEQQVYEVTYFGMAAGQFTLEVLPHKAINDRKVYHIKGTAVTSNVFSLFYKANDQIQTFIDYEGLFSHRFHVELDETKQVKNSLELYDSEKGQAYWWNRWNRKEKGYVETKEYHPMQPFSQDTLSALYFLRTQPMPPGAVLTFPVVSEGKSWEAVVTVIRREEVDSPMGRVKAIVLKPEHKLHGVLQTKGDSYLWLSDDDRKILLKMEAKVRIGTIVASLKKAFPGTDPKSEGHPGTDSQRTPSSRDFARERLEQVK